MDGVKFVILYTAPESGLDLEQKLGRCARGINENGFGLVIAESAILDNSTASLLKESKGPYKAKLARTGVEVLNYLRTDGCKRKHLRDYNNDEDENGDSF